MIRKKRGLMTLIWSFIPGAGEMYMGFFKQGMSIMTVFTLLFGLAVGLNIGPLMFVLPILWFYSFFHVHNLASMRDEEFYSIEDKFLLIDECSQLKLKISPGRGRNILAGGLILIGLTSLWNIFTDIIYDFIIPYLRDPYADMLYHIFNRVPQCVFAVLVIVIGMFLIKGKKAELLEEKRMEHEKSGSFDFTNNFYENVMEAAEDSPAEQDFGELEEQNHENA